MVKLKHGAKKKRQENIDFHFNSACGRLILYEL